MNETRSYRIPFQLSLHPYTLTPLHPTPLHHYTLTPLHPLEFNILVLGSGAATPTYARHCSSQLVTICGNRILIDCGEYTQSQLRKYHQKIQSIKMVLISHLHGDHFFGLPGLLSTMHLLGRTEPITVFAPKGARESIELLFSVSGTELRFPVEFRELDFSEPQVIVQERFYHITAFPMHHSLPCFGFLIAEEPPLLNLRPMARLHYKMTNEDCVRVKEGEDLILEDGTIVPNSELTLPRRKARSYAYCCDTSFDEALVPIVSGVDMLCMESTFDEAFKTMAEERCHCTASQAATIAKNAEVRRLMLTHFSARYREVEPLLEEARAVFPATIAAEDGGIYEINP